MAKNIGLFGKRQIVQDRRYVTGMTASRPAYKEVDTALNKEWTVDVYLGAVEAGSQDVVKDAIIAPYAKNLVTDIRQPVLLERSRQGQYTVIGRAKILPGGALGNTEDPSYRFVQHNLADLRALHVADLDYTFEEYQPEPTDEYQAEPEEPYQVIRATNAFGNQVLGPEVDEEPPQVQPRGRRVIRVRQVIPTPAKYGPRGDPLAMVWGTSVYQPIFLVVQETETIVLT